MVDIQSPTAEIRRGKKKEERRRNSMKIYMASLLHRATINNLPTSVSMQACNIFTVFHINVKIATTC